MLGCFYQLAGVTMMLCLQLLQGIVRPLKSAHQSSAIERSRSAADIILQAKSTNGGVNQVIVDANQFSSLPSELTGSGRTTVNTEHSSSSVGATATEKRTSLLSRKSERNTNTRIVNATDSEKAFDMNENVIASVPAPDAVPSQLSSAQNSDRASLLSESQLSSIHTTTTSSTVNQTDGSNSLPVDSSSSQTKKPGSGDSTIDAASSRGGTRSWVSSSSYQQKLGLRAAGRYQSVTSRLYGDNWLGSIGSRATANKTEPAASETAPTSASSSKESQPNESLIPDTVADNTASSAVSVAGTTSASTDASSKPTQSSSLHLVYSCSTSERTTVVRPSLTSESGDDDEDDGKNENNSIEEEVEEETEVDDDVVDEDDDERASESVRSGPQPKLSESKSKKAMVRWRQRLVASPPPRRAAHSPRRVEDPDKEHGTTGTGAVPSRSLQPYPAKLCLPDKVPSQPPSSPESLKHVSFDPFTLSLNAALEGELDVLQALFSQVALCSCFCFQPSVATLVLAW